eukprot:scaffold1091_cov164-Ochromonas_danica.AAC.59
MSMVRRHKAVVDGIYRFIKKDFPTADRTNVGTPNPVKSSPPRGGRYCGCCNSRGGRAPSNRGGNDGHIRADGFTDRSARQSQVRTFILDVLKASPAAPTHPFTPAVSSSQGPSL